MEKKNDQIRAKPELSGSETGAGAVKTNRFHIALCAGLGVLPAAGAFASSVVEEAPAVCNGDMVEGWPLNVAYEQPNQFVSYAAFADAGNDKRLYLEHCPSGRVLRVAYRSMWNETDAIAEHYHERVEGKGLVTQDQLAEELAAMGAETKIWTSETESCGCHIFFPEARGDKTEYSGSWQ